MAHAASAWLEEGALDRACEATKALEVTVGGLPAPAVRTPAARAPQAALLPARCA